jgi:hypothetical protein
MKFNRLAFALATACVCGSVTVMTGCLYSHKEEVKEVPVPAVAEPVAPPISSSSTTTTTTKSDDGAVDKQTTTTYTAPKP